MKRYGKILFVLLALLLVTSACGEKQPTHAHTWEPATCTRGEFCFGCGETQGEALDHTWAEATCTKAKTCTACGITEGKPLEHAADGSGVCSRCGEALNTVAKIDARGDIDHAFHTQTLVVYGGVVFEFPLYGLSNDIWPGYPSDYVICNSGGAEVAKGIWPANPKVFLGKTERGQWIWNEKTCTEYVSLAPGSYEVMYHFYDREISTPEKHEETDIYLPKGEMKTGRCQFVVK